MYQHLLKRIEGLQPGSSSAWEQLLNTLGRSQTLYQEGNVTIEDTHVDNATSDFAVLTINQFNEGDHIPQTNVPPMHVPIPPSWALNVNTGNAQFNRDVFVRRYLCGSLRIATANADSAGAVVEVTDNELGAVFNVNLPVNCGMAPHVCAGDTVPYLLTNACEAWGLVGGGATIRCATTTARWVDGNPPTVAATDDATGAAITIRLPRTMGDGDPNVCSGAPIKYAKSNDDNLYAVTDYMDDHIGTVKMWLNENENDIDCGWRYHEDSAGRQAHNYGESCDDFTPVGATGGDCTHDHDPHQLDDHNLSTAELTYVTDVTFDTETCEATVCYGQVCAVMTDIDAGC